MKVKMQSRIKPYLEGGPNTIFEFYHNLKDDVNYGLIDL